MSVLARRDLTGPVRHSAPRPRAGARRSPFIIALAVVGLAVGAGPAGAASPGSIARAAPGPPHDGIFRSTCLPSHVAADDPIVHPGESGASHQHEFFGNVTTNADSTYRSLLGQDTTCRIDADTAAYWVPSLLQDGQRVAPVKINAYYLRGRGAKRTVSFPAGLKFIAGDSTATGAQPTAVTGWKCAGTTTGLSAIPVACPAGTTTVLVIRFPECWNGRDLDSADHRSHLAYRVRGVCPASHPVRVPKLSVNVQYSLASVSGLTFASGSIYSAHADFFNAWNQRVLAALVRSNLN